MLVWIASYPRSGNAFFRVSLFQIYGHCSVREKSRRQCPPDFVPKHAFDNTLWTTLTDEEMAADAGLFFVKSHLLPAESTNPAIYLVRDGRDALVSYAWFNLVQDHGMDPEMVTPRQFRKTLVNLMTNERSPYGTWQSNVLAWLQRPNTCVVKFEQLIRSPRECVTGAIEQLGLPGEESAARLPTFEDLQHLRPHHYRRGVIGSWRDEFPTDLDDRFWRLHGEAMAALGYSRRGRSNGSDKIAA